jgi:hypothetical protein
MDRVQKLSNPKRNIPLSEPFGIYMIMLVVYTKYITLYTAPYMHSRLETDEAWPQISSCIIKCTLSERNPQIEALCFLD